MTLGNLLAIGRLQPHQADPVAIRRLLQTARRNLADARVVHVSADTRFDAAYRCIRQCADLGLWANGYRTPTSQPGHHQTALQCLTSTVGVPAEEVIVLDALRRQRNLGDYQGDPVTDAALDACIEAAARLLARTEAWLKAIRD